MKFECAAWCTRYTRYTTFIDISGFSPYVRQSLRLAPLAGGTALVIFNWRFPVSLCIHIARFMDAVEKANAERQKRWCVCLRHFLKARPNRSHGPQTKRVKDQKVGEGTYAVVYRGSSVFRTA